MRNAIISNLRNRWVLLSQGAALVIRATTVVSPLVVGVGAHPPAWSVGEVLKLRFREVNSVDGSALPKVFTVSKKP